MRPLLLVLLTLISANGQADPKYQQQLKADKPQSAKVRPDVAISESSKSASSNKSSANTKSKEGAGKADQKKSVTFESLAQLDRLIGLGTPALALSLLEDEQDRRQRFSAEWYAFEYKRIVVLLSLERWQQVIDRAQWIFDTADPGRQITNRIRLWFETQQVIARLQLKQSEIALDQLQRLLWQSKKEDRDPSLIVIWRRLVIRAYLQLEMEDDARRALVKYEQDYETDKDDIDWILLQAMVLLKTHRPEQAIKTLELYTATDEVDIDALLLIAQLQSKPGDAKKVYQQMREQLDGKVLTPSARWAKSYVAYTAAVILKDEPAQVKNLESMLSLDLRYPVFDDSYQVDADDLWDLYSKEGLAIANSKGLLLGNDKQWQRLSDKLVKSAPEKALKLNAALVLNTKDKSTLQQQNRTIVEILEKRKNGLELINKLYLHSSLIEDVEVLPDEVRYRLVDYSLSEGDYSEAARLMKTLKEPPQGKTLFDWRMRMARVLVLQGEYEQSENMIRQTFIEKPKITRKELDRYIQVVFDFQTVQQHERAIRLFDLLYIDGLDENLKREIYFWKAESYSALEKQDHAALYYLQSARVLTDGYNDLWAQAARFKAGDSLIKAGIYDDAEKVYRELLAITDSDARKALIEQSLQKIRLLKSTVKNP